MQIFQDGKWQDLTLKRCEQMTKIEQAAIDKKKAEKKDSNR